MNGVALLLALSALGVDYDVRRAEDGKLEYLVQMEPELIKSLAGGQQIHSAVPANTGNIERIVVRVGLTEPKHSPTNKLVYQNLLVEASRIASTDGRGAADPTASILWPDKRTPALNYYVKYGWQPDSQGVLSYYVQVDPTLLSQLAVGDEIRAGIDPSAGPIGRFVIQVGSGDLPKIPVEPVATARTDAGSGRTRFSPSTTTSTSDLYPGTTKSTYGPSPSTLPPVSRPSVPLASTPDYGSAAATGPEQQPLYAPPSRTPTRWGSGVSDGGANLGAPKFDTQTDYAQNQATYGDQRYAPAPFSGAAPPRGTLEPPPATQYGPPNYASSTVAQPPQLQTQFQPQSNYPPAVNYAPALAPQDRLASVNRPAPATNVSAPLAAPQINPTSGNKTSAEASSDSKPYLTMVVTFALFVSIGANMYLGWTAGEYYSRYRLATERLRSASRA